MRLKLNFTKCLKVSVVSFYPAFQFDFIRDILYIFGEKYLLNFPDLFATLNSLNNFI